MKHLAASLVLSMLSAGSLAQDSFSYQAAVRIDDAEVIPVQATLALNSVKEVAIGSELVLEFTSPAPIPECGMQ